MKNIRKKLTSILLTIAILGSSFVASYAMNNDTVPNYSNEDIEVVVKDNYDKVTNTLDLDIELKGKNDNVKVENIVFPKSEDEKQKELAEGLVDVLPKPEEVTKDHKYTYKVNENGDYEFTVNYTVALEVANEETKNADATPEVEEAVSEETAETTDEAPAVETKTVDREKQHKFTVKVEDKIKDIEEQPETTPETPEVKPEEPETTPETPEVKPEEPETTPETPEVKPEGEVDPKPDTISDDDEGSPRAGVVGLGLKTNITTDRNIDIQSRERLQVSFSPSLNIASVVHGGNVEIDLSQTNLILDENSFENTQGIEQVTYNNATRKINLKLRAPYSGSSEFKFYVYPALAAKLNEENIITATMTGFTDTGHTNKYEDVNIATAKIITTGTENQMHDATEEKINTWKKTNVWNFSQTAGTVQYNRYFTAATVTGSTSPYEKLYFKDLIIKVSGEGKDMGYGNLYLDGIGAANKGKIIGREGDAFVYSFGERNLDKIYLRNDVTIPTTAENRVYVTKFDIYDGSEYVMSFDRNITVQHVSSIYYQPVISNTTVGLGETFTFAIKPNVKSGPNPMNDLTIDIPTPNGIKVTQLGMLNGWTMLNKYEIYYEQNNSGNFIRTASVAFNDMSGVENITKVRFKQKPGQGVATTNDYDSFLVMYENESLQNGETTSIKPSSITYTNTLGQHVDSNLNGTEKTITGTSTLYNDGPSKITAGLYDGGFPFDVNFKFPTEPVLDLKARQAVKIGASGGAALEDAYMYVIVPKEVSVTPSYNGEYHKMISDSGIESGNLPEISMLKGSIPMQKFDYDSKNNMYVFKATMPMQGNSIYKFDFITSTLDFRSTTLSAGSYSIQYGVGSLTSDDVMDGELYNNFSSSTLTPRAKELLGSSVDTVYTTTTDFEIYSNSSVQGMSWSKGTLDDDWIRTDLGKSTSLVNGTVDYRYEITNTSTTTFDSYEMVGILPHVDDDYIISDGKRGSEYVVNFGNVPLTAKINGSESDVLVQYATTYNPDRFDKAGVPVTGDARWSSQAPANRADIKAIRVVLVGSKFKPGDVLTVEFQGVLPLGTPRNDEEAHNTIAALGKFTLNGDARATTYEFPPTTVKATKPQNDGELSGQIYIDQDANGSFNGLDAGMNQLTVELFNKKDMTAPVATTTTTTSAVDGSLGTFGFSNLAYNSEVNNQDVYRIRVTLPENGTAITNGANGVSPDPTEPTKYVWLMKGGKDYFKLSDISTVGPKTIENIDGAIKVVTPVKGKVQFVDKNGDNVTSNYGSNYKVELLDGTTVLQSKKTSTDGTFTLDNAVATTRDEYTLKFTNETGKAFVFDAKNAAPNDGTLKVNLEPGVESSGNVIYITDKDSPVVTELIPYKDTTANATQNPTKFEYEVSDATTTATHVWTIKDPNGNQVAGATGTDKSTIPAALTKINNGGVSGKFKLEVVATDAAKNTTTKTKEFNVIAKTGGNPTISHTHATLEHFVEVKRSKDTFTPQNVIDTFGLTAKDVLNQPLGLASYTMTDLDKVDTTTTGTYIVKVQVTDSEGLKSSVLEVKYTVRDTTKPVLGVTKNNVTLNRSAKDTSAVQLSDIEALVSPVTKTDNNKASDSMMVVKSKFDFSTIDLKNDGTYTINLYTTDAAGLDSDLVPITVKVVVYDDIDIGKGWGIKSDPSFTATVGEVDNKDKIIAKSNVKVFKISDGTEVTATITADKEFLPEGEHTITFGVVGSGITTTTKANIYTVIADGYGLVVNDFKANFSDVQTSAGINTAGGAKVFRLSDHENVTSTMTIKHELDGAPVTKLPTGVNQSVKFFVEGRIGLEKTVKAQVFDKFNPVSDRGLIANDFSTELSKVQSKNGIITESGAKVYIASTGVVDTTLTDALAFEVDGAEVIKLPLGRHSIKVSSGSSLSKDITGLVANKIVDGVAMSGNTTFSISSAEANNEGRIVTVAGVHAWKVNADGTSTAISDDDISVKSPALPVTNGATVEFTTTQGGSFTSVVSVSDTEITITADQRIVVTLDEVKQATDLEDLLLKRAKVTAKRNGADVPMTIKGTTVADMKALKQTRETPFQMVVNATDPVSTDTKDSEVIFVYVVDSYDPVSKLAISARNFAIELDQVNDTNLKISGNAKAWSMAALPNGIPVDLHQNIAVTEGNEKVVGLRDVTFSITNGGLTETVTVKGLVANTIDNDKKEAVHATNFSISLADAAVEQNLKDGANAKGYNIADITNIQEIPVTATPSSITTPGNHTVKFKTANGTSADAKAEVKVKGNENDGFALYANNFVIEQSAVSGADIKALAGTELYDTTKTPNAKITNLDKVTVTGDLSQLGENTITLTHEKGATVTVKGYVVDKLEGNIGFEGHDFNSSIENSNNKTKIINNAEFKAYDFSNIANIETITSETEIGVAPIPTASGEETITFTVRGEEYTVTATIFNKGVEDANYAIYANNAVILKDDLATTNLKTAAGVRATKDGQILGLDKVEVDKELTTVGKHEVTFTITEHPEATITVTIIVVDKIENNEAIYANNFTISLADAATAQNLIDGADAKAYNITDMNNIIPVSVTPNPATITTVGEKAVEFKTAKGTKTSVTATVKKGGDQQGGHAIYADDFVILKSDVAGANPLVKAGVELFDTSVTPNKQIFDLSTVTVTGDLSKMGPNTLKFEHPSGAEVVVTGYVVDEIKGDVAFKGHDYTSTVDNSDSKPKVITNSEFAAYNISDMSNIRKIDDTDVAVAPIPDAAGEHVIKFKTAGQEYIVVALLTNNGVVDGDYSIYANNFAIKKEELVGSDFVELSGAKAYFKGTPLDKSQIEVVNKPETVGKHQVKLKVSDQSATVEITVIVANTIDNEQAIYANDFTIKLDNANVEQNLIDAADAKAFDISDLNNIQPLDVKAIPNTLTKVGKQEVTFSTKTNPATTATAEGNVTKKGAEDANFAVYANDFVILKSNAQSASIKESAGLRLYDVTTTPDSEITDLSGITVTGDLSKMGANEITFTHTESGLEVKVVGYVVDKIDGNIAFTGHDFQSDLNSANDKPKVIGKAEFKAFDISNMTDVKDITNSAIVAPIPTEAKDYNIKFTVSGKEYGIKATIRNNGTEVDGYSIYANNIAMTKAQITGANWIDLAGAKAFHGTTALGNADIEVLNAPTTVGEHTVTYKVKDQTASIDVTVIVADKIENGEAIYATDFSIKLTDAAIEQNLIDGADAKAFNVSDLNNIQPVNVTATPNKITAVGETEVTFKTTKGTSTTATADVKTDGNEQNGFTIYANNFVVLKANANDDDIIELAGTSVFKSSVTPNEDVGTNDVVVTSGDLSKMGPNPITLTHTPSGASIDIVGYVADKIDGNIAFTGHDFQSTLNNSDTDGKVKINAGFTAFDISNVADIKDLTTAASVEPVPTAADDYAIKFTAGGKEYSVNATIRNNGHEEDGYSIYANNFAVKLADVNSINWITEAGAEAFHGTTALTPNDIEVLNKPETVGKHTVTYKVKGQTAATTVTVVVADEINTTNKEAIYATNFTLSLAEAGVAQNIIDFADAKAYDISDLNDIQEVGVTANPATITKVGTTTVTYSTVKGTLTTADADVKTNGDVQGDYALYANNFVILKGDVQGADLKAKAGVELYDITETPHAKVDNLNGVTVSGSITKLGKNEITFTHTDGATVKVNAYMVESIKGDVAFSGHNFESTVNDTDEKSKVITNAGFEAYDISDINNIQEVTNTATVAPIPTKAGDYTITFTVLGETYTVEAVVRNNGKVDGEFSIYANNFVVELANLGSVNWIGDAGAEAFESGVKLDDNKIIVTGKPTTIGKHTVTYTVDGQPGATTDITVIVANKLENDEAIYAKNFTVKADETIDSSSRIVGLAGAKAYDVSDLNDIKPLTLKASPTILGTPGLVPVTLTTTTSNETSMTVEADVTTGGGEANGITIYANNFVIEQNQLAGKDIFELAEVELWKSSVDPHEEITPITDVVSDKTIDQLVMGANTITYTHTPSGATTTATAYVVDKIDGHIAFKGHDYTSTVEDSNQRSKVIANAEFEAYDLSALPVIKEVTDDVVVTPIPVAEGNPTISFKVSGKTYTVDATLRNKGIVDGDYAIYADNIAMLESQLSGANFIDLAHVVATHNGTALTPADITVIGTPTTVGFHKVKFQVTAHPTTEIEVTVVVADDIRNNEAIFATDFGITLDKASHTTDSEANLIAGANAKAYNVAKLESIYEVPVSANPTKLTTLGKQDVTFRTTNGVATKAQADVTKKGNEFNGFEIFANDFVILKEDTVGKTDADILELAGARLFEKSQLVNVPDSEITPIVNVIVTGDMSVMGKNDITFEHVSGAKVTISAYVVDELNGNIAFAGHNFKSTVNEADTDGKVKDLAEFKAFDISNKADIKDVSAAAVVDPVPTEAKDYRISFKVSGRTYFVDAMIRNNGIIDGEYSIHANNFAVSIADLPYADLYDLAGVTAYKGNTKLTENDVEFTDVPTTVGKHEMTITVKDHPAATTKVTVIVANHIRNNQAITASDFTIALADASVTQNLIDGAHAIGYDLTDLNDIKEIPVTAAPTAITVPGVTEVTFKTAKNATTKVNATVKTNGDEAGDFALYANHFVVTNADVNKDLKELAGVELFDTTKLPNVKVDDLTDVSVTGSLANMGPNTITFTHMDGATVTVTGYRVDELQGDIAFVGHDFRSTLNDSDDREKVIDNAEFKAYNVSNISNIQDLTSTAVVTPIPTKADNYEINFKVSNKNYKVNAIIRNKGVVDGDYEIYANNFAMTKDELENADWVALAGAEAYFEGVKLDASDIEVVNAPTTIGNHTVTYRVKNHTDATIDVQVVVADILLNKEAIYAEDFAIKLSDANIEQNLIDGAEAKAFDISDLNNIQPVAVTANPSSITTIGKKVITFKTVKGTSTTATADVVTNGDESNGFALYANNFVVLKANAKNEDVLTLAGARLFDTDETPDKEITDLSSVTVTGTFNNMGENTFVLTHTDGATVTVKGYVVDSIQNGIAFAGHDFQSTLDNSDDRAKVIDNAEFEAFDVTDVSDIKDLTSTANVSPIPAASGDYEIKFVVSGETYKVNAKIRNNGKVDGSYSIYANNFAMTKDQLTGADWVALAGAEAFKDGVGLTDADAITVTNIPTTVGEHTVTYTVKDHPAATIDVKVIVGDTIKGTEVIYASDFTIALADANITQNLIDYADAKAFDISDLNDIKPIAVTPNPTGLTVPGVQEVTYSTANNAKTTANADVKTNGDSANNFTLYANNFVVTVDELTGANLNNLAGVELFNSTNTPHIPVTDLTSVTADKAISDLVIGENTIVFTHTDGATVTVKGYVVNHKEGNVAFEGHDFQSTVDDSDTKGKVITNADFKAYDVSNISNITVINDTDVTVAPIPDKAGDYEIVFTAKGKTHKVDATIRNKGVVDGDYSIFANNIAISRAELENANWIELADAKAFHKGVALTDDKIEVTGVPTTVGSYTVTFTVKDHTDATIDVAVVVADVIDNNNKEAIYATDFTISSDKVTKPNFITYANAEAFDISDMNNVQPVAVEVKTDLPTVAGEHEVKFATAKGTSTTATATVKSNGDIQGNHALYANNFVIEAKDVNGANLKDLAGVELFKTSVTPHEQVLDLSDVSVTGSLANKGANSITFTHSGGATVTVQGYVVDSMDPDTKEAIIAHDFNTKVEDINETNFITLAGASAIDYSDVANIVSVPVNVTSEMPTAAGDYDVTFATAKGTGITVNATIRSKGIVNPGVDSIFANNFVVTLKDLNAGTDLKELAGVKAYDESTTPATLLPNTNVTIENAPTTVGEHDVTFKLASGTKVTVKGFVVDSVNPETKEAIIANDFALPITDVSEDNFVKAANAKAYDVSDIENIVEIPVKVATELPYSVGEYKVEFATAAGTSIEVNATIRAKGIINPGVDSIYANDFSIALKDLTVETVFEKSGVVAFNESVRPHTQLPNTAITLVEKLPTTVGVHELTFKLASGTQVKINVHVTATFVVEANDIVMTLADFNKAKANGTLSDEILKRSNAKAIVVDTGEEVGPLSVDVTNLLSLDVKDGNTYDVDIAFELDAEDMTPAAGGRMLRAMDNVQTVKTTIKLIIPKNPVKPIDPVKPVDPKDPTDPGKGGGKLPGTGIPTQSAALAAGLFAIASGLVLIIAKRRKEEEQETNETPKE